MSLPFPTLTADEAAELIQDGQRIGFSGFTAAGAAKGATRTACSRVAPGAGGVSPGAVRIAASTGSRAKSTAAVEVTTSTCSPA